MTYLRNKRIVILAITFFLFFVFDGATPLDYVFAETFLRFFPERKEKSVSQEMVLLEQRITDLNAELLRRENAKSDILANIIFGGGYIFSESIFLNKGSDDGAEVGDLVVYKSSIAVAKLEEVFSKHSKAAPFSRFANKVFLRSGAEKGILFEAEGGGGREIVAILPKGSGVNAGDSVYIAEAPQFLAGIVEWVEKKESRDFEELNIVLPFSLRSITEVSIVKNVKK